MDKYWRVNERSNNGIEQYKGNNIINMRKNRQDRSILRVIGMGGDLIMERVDEKEAIMKTVGMRGVSLERIRKKKLNCLGDYSETNCEGKGKEKEGVVDGITEERSA